MTQPVSNPIDVSKLRQEAQEPLTHLADRLQADLGDNLRSLTVVGSVLTDDWHGRQSDINTVLLVDRRNHQLLQTIAGYGPDMGKRRLRAPLLMTAEYLRRSLDVFSIELLDFQLNHLTVCGDDPFAGLEFEREHVRLQCERELKAALIQLRQGYIRAMGKGKHVADLLLSATTALVPVVRALLWLADKQRPLRAVATIEAAAAQFGFDAEGLAALTRARLERQRPEGAEVEQRFEQAYQAIDALSRHVDTLPEANRS